MASVYTTAVFQDPFLQEVYDTFAMAEGNGWVTLSDFDTSLIEKLREVLPEEDYVSLHRPVPYFHGEHKTDIRADGKERHDFLCLYFGSSWKTDIELQEDYYKINYAKAGMKLVLYDIEHIFRVMPNNKMVPLKVKDMMDFTMADNRWYQMYYDILLKHLTAKSLLFKDIAAWQKKDGTILLPVKTMDLMQYHNLKEFFHAQYKLSNEIQYNWNTHDINLSYLILKTWKHVDQKDRSKLLMLKEFPAPFQEDAKVYSGGTVKEKIAVFLTRCIEQKVGVQPTKEYSEAQQWIHDYIHMALDENKTVSLRFQSIRSVKEAHDKMMEQHRQHLYASAAEVRIEKSTKFRHLREILPKEYEWITTSRRLNHEADIMHHCVWSYAGKINRDLCQIYSYVSPKTGNRYTLEFQYQFGKYVCTQIQGKYDCGDPENIGTKVDQILREDTIKDYS